MTRHDTSRFGARALRGARTSAAALAAGVAIALVPSFAFAQQAFPSAEAASVAFVDAVASNDDDALARILGADWKRFIPTQDIDEQDVYAFLAGWAQSHRIVASGPDQATLAVGKAEWTLPIPIVKSAAGWRFDTRAGAEEIRTRRIGRNELAAIQAAFAYFDAQKDYALADRNGDGLLEYAQKFASAPGKRDGLYWPVKAGEPESPLGPLYAAARPGEGYHGYRFKILKAQGKAAPGGTYSYLIGGRMTSGFALVGWPLRYGDTGVMSFILSHDGQLYQRDLGPGSDAAARATTRFNPDSTWTKVGVPGS